MVCKSMRDQLQVETRYRFVRYVGRDVRRRVKGLNAPVRIPELAILSISPTSEKPFSTNLSWRQA